MEDVLFKYIDPLKQGVVLSFIQKFYSIYVEDYKNKSFELRCLRGTDAPLVDEAIQESSLELKRFLAWPHLSMNLEQRGLYIEKCFEKWCEGKGYFLGLFPQGEKKLICGIGMHPRCPLNPLSLEIGYYTRSSETGKGWATLSTQVLTVAALVWLGADTVRISCATNNTSSKAVIKNCGFVFEGHLRNWTAAPTQKMVEDGYIASPDSCMYSIVREDLPPLMEWFLPLAKAMVVVSQSGEPLPPLEIYKDLLSL